MWANEVMLEHGCSFVHQKVIDFIGDAFRGEGQRRIDSLLQQPGGPGSATTTAVGGIHGPTGLPRSDPRIVTTPTGTAFNPFAGPRIPQPIPTGGGFTGVTRTRTPSIIDRAGTIGSFTPGGADPRKGFVATCGPGFKKDAQGRCVKVGLIGTMERLIPGGATGLQPMLEDFGEAVMGRFGAALVPAQFATTRLRCPRGAVLGMDNLCYNKRDLKKSERKWNPGTRPILTGGDVNTLRKAQRLQHRMAKLGLTGTPTHHRRKTRKLLR